MFLIKEFIRFLVKHSIISKATVKTLIGLFLYIPFVIVPIIVVVVLLYASRKINARAISIVNLILAVGAMLFMLSAISDWPPSRSSPPLNPLHPITIREIAFDSITIFWLAGAIGLFFRKRLAWIGSVIGVGALVSFFAASLIVIAAAYFYPDAELIRDREFGMAGYIFSFVIGAMTFSLPLVISLRLLFGLFQMRKEIFHPHETV